MFRRGPLRDPWPDGPRTRVAEPFQEACLDGQCLMPLIVRRPDAALEVLLAVSIEEPKELDPFGGHSLIDSYGVEHWHGGYPPMYFRGPFLSFFSQAPQQALSYVVRLVNFATHRWAECQRRHVAERSGEEPPAEEALGIRLLIRGQERLWLGSGQVLYWHLDSPPQSRVLSCALMALEKWLYDELDQGRSIDAWIEWILTEGESLALVGVLIDVGKKALQLFRSSLRDILSGWELYYWDHSAVMQRSHMTVGMMGWWRQPESLQEIAKLAHRGPSNVCPPRNRTPVPRCGPAHADVLRGNALVGPTCSMPRGGLITFGC